MGNIKVESIIYDIPTNALNLSFFYIIESSLYRSMNLTNSSAIFNPSFSNKTTLLHTLLNGLNASYGKKAFLYLSILAIPLI
jgi:hypothetical protein